MKNVSLKGFCPTIATLDYGTEFIIQLLLFLRNSDRFYKFIPIIEDLNFANLKSFP